MSVATLACPLCGGNHDSPEGPLFARLWLYTNYDCNLSCSYCLVSSSPTTPRRGLPFPTFQQLIDEALDLGCEEVFLTGGEPAILPHIRDMIAYALPRMRVIMLTNGMLWKGSRLARLEAAHQTAGSKGLTLQISLDSGAPDLHDYHRGAGTWARTVEGIRVLRERGFHVRTGTTETIHSRRRLQELKGFLTGLGIPPEDQIIRPLAKRGESRQGTVLTREDLVPEMTVDVDGVYWHPVGTNEDMRISQTIFPLRQAAQEIVRLWHEMGGQAKAPRIFR